MAIIKCSKCGIEICVSEIDFKSGRYNRMCPKCLKTMVPFKEVEHEEETLKPHKTPRKKSFAVEPIEPNEEEAKEDGVGSDMPTV